MKTHFQIAATLTLSLILSLILLSSMSAQPAPPTQPAKGTITVLTVPTMDCNGCAKKVTAQMQVLPGVSRVVPNAETRVVYITSQDGVGVSPRAIWEAAEKAGFPPTKIDSPYGVFATKPRN